jgi:hypothetical protein
LREESRLRVFENRVLRKAFGPKRDEATGKWRKLHNEEPNDLYCSLSVIRTIKLRIMRLAGHVVHMSERKGVSLFRREKLRKREHLEEPGVEGRIILICNFGKCVVGAWTGSSWLRIGRGRALMNGIMNFRFP